MWEPITITIPAWQALALGAMLLVSIALSAWNTVLKRKLLDKIQD